MLMGEHMGHHNLENALRSLCYRTEWKYSIFWKLNRTHMDGLSFSTLTWDDAYYDDEVSCPSEVAHANMGSALILHSLRDGHYKRDPLGLALAKMSNLVFSLGEGTIGQVAFTGSHQWIFADKPDLNSRSSWELSNGWNNQFLAGVKTVAVVPIFSYGVVQLGSSTLIGEDLKLVSHIKDIFGLLLNSLIVNRSVPVRNVVNQNGINMKNSGLEGLNDYSYRMDQVVSNKNPAGLAHLLPSLRRCYNGEKFVHVADEDMVVKPTLMDCENVPSLISKSISISSGFQKQLNSMNTGEVNTIGLTKMYMKSTNSMSMGLDMPKIDYAFIQRISDVSTQDRSKCDEGVSLGDVELQLDESVVNEAEAELKNRADSQINGNWVDTVETPLKFSAGCELQEALGSAFKEDRDLHVWDRGMVAEKESISQLTNESFSSLLTPCSGSQQLLEAVVASACLSGNGSSTENSWCKSANILTTENVLQCPDLSLIEMGNELVSRTSSICSGLSERKTEQAKINRKKVKTGENCRPRPRDRQLIQDRIKELRQIVPNVTKCSIDTLLDRTIRHMLFLQSVTRHAEKIKRYEESKRCDKGGRLLGTWSNERGASWAIEVGGQYKSCPIVIENLDMNGQMHIEMLCEECNLFLQIAEVIRGLALTILKGEIETRDDKTWACFLVEGQENGHLRRMDIMWSLMGFFQPKIKP